MNTTGITENKCENDTKKCTKTLIFKKIANLHYLARRVHLNLKTKCTTKIHKNHEIHT